MSKVEKSRMSRISLSFQDREVNSQERAKKAESYCLQESNLRGEKRRVGTVDFHSKTDFLKMMYLYYFEKLNS